MEKKPKTLGKIKLNQLYTDEFNLVDREMNALKGGNGSCVCVCMGSSYPEASRPIASYTNKAT